MGFTPTLWHSFCGLSACQQDKPAPAKHALWLCLALPVKQTWGLPSVQECMVRCDGVFHVMKLDGVLSTQIPHDICWSSSWVVAGALCYADPWHVFHHCIM